jgi:hypothetical protein
MRPKHQVREERGGTTHIWLKAPATSVQTVSMSSFKVWRAKTLSSGSSSERKPRTPVAVTRPGIARDEGEEKGGGLEGRLHGRAREWEGFEDNGQGKKRYSPRRCWDGMGMLTLVLMSCLAGLGKTRQAPGGSSVTSTSGPALPGDKLHSNSSSAWEVWGRGSQLVANQQLSKTTSTLDVLARRLELGSSPGGIAT